MCPEALALGALTRASAFGIRVVRTGTCRRCLWWHRGCPRSNCELPSRRLCLPLLLATPAGLACGDPDCGCHGQDTRSPDRSGAMVPNVIAVCFDAPAQPAFCNSHSPLGAIRRLCVRARTTRKPKIKVRRPETATAGVYLFVHAWSFCECDFSARGHLRLAGQLPLLRRTPPSRGRSGAAPAVVSGYLRGPAGDAPDRGAERKNDTHIAI